MGHVGHPEFIKTPPLEVAIKPDELRQYYEDKTCCFAGYEGDHWVDLLACQNWPDMPYYAGYYSAFSREYLNEPQFAEKFVMLEGTVVDVRDVPELESGQSIILIHRDITMTNYCKIDEFTSVIEALYHDPELEGDFDEMTVLIGRLKGIKWREQLIRQTRHWVAMFEKQRIDRRMLRMSDEVIEADG